MYGSGRRDKPHSRFKYTVELQVHNSIETANIRSVRHRANGDEWGVLEKSMQYTQLDTVYLMASKYFILYRGADKSLARPTSRCILFDGENISFDASLVIYIYIYIYIYILLIFLQL